MFCQKELVLTAEYPKMSVCQPRPLVWIQSPNFIPHVQIKALISVADSDFITYFLVRYWF